MNQKPKQDQCSVYERRGQLVLALNCEKMIPENAPVRLVSAVLEELDYERLYRAYSPRGRKSAADPQVLFEVMVYGYLCGIYSSRKLEEACRYRVGKATGLTSPAALQSYLESLATCAQGRKLSLCREYTEEKDSRFVTTAWYRCENCAGCPCRSLCCRAKDPEQPKQLCLQKTFWEKRAETTQRITSQRGIHLRLCRSIQVEGAFALLKNDFGFRRFLTRGRADIRAELFLLAMAFDLKKLWMKREHGRLRTRVSEKMTA